MQSLVLGTAQWGSAYGVTNQTGRLSNEEIAKVIATAKEAGLGFVDTAANYGDAEFRLAPWAQDFGITSKVKGADHQSIEKQVRESLSSLQISRLRVCLIHDWSTMDLVASRAALSELRRLQRDGLIEKIGFSAYDESDLVKVSQYNGVVQCVQLPISALDQRMMQSESVWNLKSQGVEVQARSIFLQGLLASRSETTQGRHVDVIRFHEICERAGMNPIEAALDFVKSLVWVDQVVVGVTSAVELQTIVDYWNSSPPTDLSFLGSNDLNLIDPRLWNLV
ncbi:MAG: aldo/keto reductase [Candidatus Nanopelagicales bacterium]|nr:aldo/keto reductase [Candidatus Nanopelagicales bacterium]